MIPSRPPGGPVDFTPLDAVEIFVGLHNAYLSLMSGQTHALVKIGDRESRYSRGDLPAVERALYRYASMAMRIDPVNARKVGADVWLANPRAGSMRLYATTSHNSPYSYLRHV